MQGHACWTHSGFCLGWARAWSQSLCKLQYTHASPSPPKDALHLQNLPAWHLKWLQIFSSFAYHLELWCSTFVQMCYFHFICCQMKTHNQKHVKLTIDSLATHVYCIFTLNRAFFLYSCAYQKLKILVSNKNFN